ncbi:MAG: hypothetical protein WCY86_11095 [Spirosomataceae bacterium]|mgnify:CR=1 FL=1
MNLKAPKLSSPFSSNTEEEKVILNERLNLYKEKLDDQWEDVKSNLFEHGKRAAVIGGVILGVYGLFNLLVPKEEEDREEVKTKKSVKNSGLSLSGALQSILWAAAMGWAKQKVVDYVVADHTDKRESEE